MLPFWAVALLGFLIVARCTRFLNSDKLFEPVVDRLEAWARAGGLWRARLAYLVTCPWCASIWISLPVATVAVVTMSPYSLWPSTWLTVGLWLGYSWIYGILAGLLDDE